jgi:serine/threonine protein kinase
VGQELATGDILEGKYAIGPRLGQGGMGVVYLAEHVSLGHKVAVKVLHPTEAEDPNMIARFKVEARSAASIRHRNLVEVTDFGITPDRRPFFVMEYLNGESLADRLDRRHTLTEREVVEIADQILSGLGSAHRGGVVHRDLKPENVFLARGDERREVVKLLDFGIAKIVGGSRTHPGKKDSGARPLTQQGTVLGTPGYMAPETIEGDLPVDQRADLFSVGVLIYEMLTGRRPFTGGGYLEVMSQTVSRPVPRPTAVRPDISEAMERLVLTALAKDPIDRFQSADEFVRHLTAAAVGRVPDDARPCNTRVGMPSIAPNAALTADSLGLSNSSAARTAALDAPAVRARKPVPVAHHSPSRSTFRRRARGPRFFTPLLILFLLALAGAVYFFFFHEDPFKIVAHESRTARHGRAATPGSPSTSTDGSSDSGAAATTGLPASVTLWLELKPRNAKVTLNGEALTDRPLVVPSSNAPATLRVSAPGYVPRDLSVVPDREHTLRIELKRRAVKRH